MVLARSESSPQRFYSMSAQIRQERTAYYDILEQTQKGDLDITPWMEWFLGCLGRATRCGVAINSALLANPAAAVKVGQESVTSRAGTARRRTHTAVGAVAVV